MIHNNQDQASSTAVRPQVSPPPLESAPASGGRTATFTELPASTLLLPLRLFLGLSFVAGAVDKLTTPGFFQPDSFNYIGAQLAGFAQQSPLGGFLTAVAVPNAVLFGWLVLLGELAIGLGTLLGLFSRPAALGGLLLSLTLWLTASWAATPFFLGSDLPYAMGWLTLALARPHLRLSLDGLLQRKGLLPAIAMTGAAPAVAGSGQYAADSGNNPAQAVDVLEDEMALPPALARRHFLAVAGATLLAGGVTGLAWYNSIRPAATPTTAQPAASPIAENTTSGAVPATATATAAASSTAIATTAAAPATAVVPATATIVPATTAAAPAATVTNAPVPTSTAAPVSTVTPTATKAVATTAAVTGTIITSLSKVAAGSALAFTTPDTGEKALLIHQADGTVNALSSICTHQGCEVGFNKASQALVCPCHGAQYNSKTGAVTNPPATRALKSFKVSLDGNGNVVYQRG